MHIATACIILVSIAVNHIHCRPAIQDSIKCFNHACPEGTTSCEKNSSVTDDRKYLDIEFKCYGKTGVLETFKEQVNNPYHPSVNYQGYAFTAVFNTVVDTDDDEVKKVDTEHIETNNDIEKFDR